MPSTTYMNLVLPIVGVTPGPTWADNVAGLNSLFTIIDEHDHTLNRGALVPVAGLDINDNLDMAGYDITNIDGLVLNSLPAALSSGATTVFSYNGELYFRDGAGNSFPLTSGGAVAITGLGNITGMGGTDALCQYSETGSYTGIFKFINETAPTLGYAGLHCGDIRIFEMGGGSSNYIQIKSPTALAASYDFTLPAAVPASTSLVTIASTGALAHTLTPTITSLILSAFQLTTGAGPGKLLMSDAGGNASWANVIPTGTKMVFYQASAPLGWTHVVITDYFLHVVNQAGIGGSLGGGVIGAGTWSLPSHASHTHTISAFDTDGIVNIAGGSWGDFAVRDGGGTWRLNWELGVGSGGGNGQGQHSHDIPSHNTGGPSSTLSHTHGLAQHQYADVIICSKD